jgi:hypothetical protein
VRPVQAARVLLVKKTLKPLKVAWGQRSLFFFFSKDIGNKSCLLPIAHT